MRKSILVGWWCSLLVFASINTNGALPPKSQLPAVAVRRAGNVVKQLYKQIIKRHPLGLPSDADKSVIWPFLSGELIHKLEVARVCEADLLRQHSGENGKPPIPWLETGLFSGDAEEALPAEAVIKDVLHQRDGSFLVIVQLIYRESFETYGRTPNPKNTFHWDVGLVVVPEVKGFKVDDVLFYKEGSSDIESRLSQKLSKRCANGRWVG
jgi:hypothetical protein